MARTELGSRSAASLAMLLFPFIAQAQVTFDLSSIARPGDAAAVPPELSSVYFPSLNERGDVAFEADGAVFLHSKGTTRMLAAFGDPAPGGGTFTSARLPSLNAQGQVAFIGLVAAPGRSGIFFFTGDAVTRVVSANDPSPEGGSFYSFYGVSLNDAGQMAFHAYTGTGDGIFLFSQGAISLLALRGQPAPGGGTFHNFQRPAINASGQVVFSDIALGIFLAVEGTVIRVARFGDPAPGGEGATFTSLSFLASINDAGEVAFWGYASPPGRGGIYLFSGGKLARVIADRDPAPEGEFFVSVSYPSLNAAGQIAFQGRVSGVPGAGVFLYSKGGLTQVMRPQQPSPEGDLFRQALDPAVNSEGQVVFTGLLANHLSGIYLYSGKAITRVAGQGDPIDRKPRFTFVSALKNGGAGRVLFSASTFPGGDGVFDEDRNPIARQADPAPEGGVFTSVSLPGLNDRGEMAFVAGNSRGPNDLYLLSGGILNRILSTGDPAPEGGTFSDFYNPSLNNKGEIAFVGNVFPLYNWGLYVGSGVFRRLVSSGDPAPGGGTFASFGHSASLNDSGQILFSALVSTPGRSGIFLWSEGSVQSVAQQGDAAPGGGSFLSVLQPSMNASGQVAFGTNLTSGEWGVFLFSGGVLSSIARSGDPAPGGGTIAGASSPSLNDAGQVALQATVGSRGVIYLFSDGVLSTIVGGQDPAPGGGVFAFVNSPQLDARSRVAFLGAVSSSTGAFLATPYASGCTGVFVDSTQK